MSLKEELDERSAQIAEVESDLRLQCTKFEDLLNDYENLEESAIERSKVEKNFFGRESTIGLRGRGGDQGVMLLATEEGRSSGPRQEIKWPKMTKKSKNFLTKICNFCEFKPKLQHFRPEWDHF